MATYRSYSRLRRRPLVRLAGTLHAPRSLAHVCGLTSVRREPASKFRRRRRVMVPLLVESYSGDLSAPLMLTLLPWDFLRPTRAYRYAGTCRARRSSAWSWTAHNAHSVDARATGAAHTPAALCRSPHTVRPRNLRRVPWRAQRDLHDRMRRPDTHARAHVLPRSPDELSSCKWAAAV